jgi:hypothetical protein
MEVPADKINRRPIAYDGLVRITNGYFEFQNYHKVSSPLSPSTTTTTYKDSHYFYATLLCSFQMFADSGDVALTIKKY